METFGEKTEQKFVQISHSAVQCSFGLRRVNNIFDQERRDQSFLISGEA